MAALKTEQLALLEELETAKRDGKEHSESAAETQFLYQNELVQHGKSMEELLSLKSKVRPVRERGEGGRKREKREAT